MAHRLSLLRRRRGVLGSSAPIMPPGGTHGTLLLGTPTGCLSSQRAGSTVNCARCKLSVKEVLGMEREERTDGFTALEERFSAYEVYDPDGEKIGKVDDLFVDEQDNPEYIGVKMGFLGTSSTLIPWGVVNSTDDEGRRIIVSVDKAKAKDGPAFDDDREITPEFEKQVYSYYGLQATQGAEERGAYGEYYGEEHPGVAMGDSESGEFREHDPAAEGASEPGGDLDDEDELRVQRTEEELRAGTREREAGALNVRKRVVTERQRMEVPTQGARRSP